jgi:Spy/CpxP family protein refolding chaperone
MKQGVRWKVVLYLTAIFAAGTISGWVVGTQAAKDKAFAPPKPNEIAASLRDRMHSKLNLTPEQAEQVDAIIDCTSKEIQSLHGDCIKRIRQGISSRNAQIKALLTPEQQKLFRIFEKERPPDLRNKDGRRSRSGKGRERDENGRDRGETGSWNELKGDRVTNDLPAGQQTKEE